MSGASIEETLELWAASLREVKARMRPLFTQERVAASAGLFLDGLLGEERRKTGWMRAEAAGDPGPWRQQAILGRGRWDADALRDIVREYVVETLGGPRCRPGGGRDRFSEAGQGLVRRGSAVHRLCGQDHQLPDRRVRGLCLGHGHAFIDRALYLPQAWASDPARRAAAHVPQADCLCHQATPGAAPWSSAPSRRGCRLPGSRRQHLWDGRGRDGPAARRQGLCARRQRHSQFNSWGAKPPIAGTAAEIASTLDPSAWQRLSAGAGAQGERLFDWAYLELADLEAAEYNQNLSGLWTRGLLIRRNIADGDLAFFATWCPAGTPVAVLVTVEGQRWAIEDSFETAKNELGLDHNETRSWHGWHRHVSLVMLAFAMMAAIRRQANMPAPPKSSLRMIRKSRH